MLTAAIVDQWGLIRLGIETSLRRSGVSVIGSATTATELFALLDQSDDEDSGVDHNRVVDIVVVGSTADVAQEAVIRRASCVRRARVIALTPVISPAAVMELCAAGAYAVTGREDSEVELTRAVAAVIDGRRYVAAELLRDMFDPRSPMPSNPRFGLTERRAATSSSSSSPAGPTPRSANG